MTPTLVAALPLLLACAAQAADSTLLSMVMPDVKVLAGLQVDSARKSPFGQYILGHMQMDDADFKKLLDGTGFDPRRDLTEIVLASNWSSENSRWLVLAHGSFNTAAFANAVKSNGGSMVSFQGVDILSGPPEPAPATPAAPSTPGAPSTAAVPPSDSVIAFLDASNAAFGDLPSVKSAIQRFQHRRPGVFSFDSALSSKIASLSAANDFWFVTLVPLAEFSDAMPDPNLSQAISGGFGDGITEARGGVKFGDSVRMSAEAVTRSEKDANSLLGAIRFLTGLLQSNHEKNSAAAQLSPVIAALDARIVNGNVVSLSVSVPEAQIEQIMNSAKQEAKHPASKQ